MIDGQNEQLPQSQTINLPSEKTKGKIFSITSNIRKLFKAKNLPSQQEQFDNIYNEAPIKSDVDYEIERILAERQKEPPEIKRRRQERYEEERLSKAIIAYHGTAKDFDEFKPGQLAWFTESLSNALVKVPPTHLREIVKLVKLRIVHPYHHSSNPLLHPDLNWVKKMKALGYDGVTWEQPDFGRVWMPFDNDKQIEILATSARGQSLDEIAKYFAEQIVKIKEKVMLPGEMDKKISSLY